MSGGPSFLRAYPADLAQAMVAWRARMLVLQLVIDAALPRVRGGLQNPVQSQEVHEKETEASSPSAGDEIDACLLEACFAFPEMLDGGSDDTTRSASGPDTTSTEIPLDH